VGERCARFRCGYGRKPSLPRLSERPFRPLPGGSLRKFPRRLGQFPRSFPAKARWGPRSSGEVRSGSRHTHATADIPTQDSAEPFRKEVGSQGCPSRKGRHDSLAPWRGPRLHDSRCGLRRPALVHQHQPTSSPIEPSVLFREAERIPGLGRSCATSACRWAPRWLSGGGPPTPRRRREAAPSRGEASRGQRGAVASSDTSGPVLEATRHDPAISGRAFFSLAAASNRRWLVD